MPDDTVLAVKRWTEMADHDLLTAETVLDLHPPLLEIACYHCQQCAEKYLKAFLVFKRTEFPKTHDLRRLLALCAEHDEAFMQLDEAALAMTGYGVAVRYPDDWRDIALGEAGRALVHARAMRSFTRDVLSKSHAI